MCSTFRPVPFSLAFLILGVLFAGCDRSQELTTVQPVEDMASLVVLSPHAPVIREAFAPRFNEWHEEKYGQPVNIRWIQRGTIECYHRILATHDRTGMSNQDRVDVFFGGGVPIHQDVANRGYSKPVQLPEEILSQIPKELYGQPLYAEDGTWYGSALNGLGIVFNRKACDARGLTEPGTWADLADPAYSHSVVLADPSKSGSSAQCLVMILLSQGWDKGFEIMTGILGNTGGMLPSSGMIGPNVGSGLTVAGFQPEFVARMMIADQPDTLGYVNPPAATSISPDPITVLKTARNPETADRFVEFVLSEEGQSLWALKPEEGGPAGQALYRNPIRPDIYTKYGDKLVVEYNPFELKQDFDVDMEKLEVYTALIPFLINAMCGENHYALQKAWRQATAPGADSDRYTDLVMPPFSEEDSLEFARQCLDQQKGVELEEAWTAMFRDRYAEIIGTPAASR